MNVGLGFHAQMTLEEAAAFSEARETRLTAQVEDLSSRAAELKAKIKIAVGAVDEVSHLASPPTFLSMPFAQVSMPVITFPAISLIGLSAASRTVLEHRGAPLMSNPVSCLTLQFQFS